MTDDAIWKRRFFTLMLARLSGTVLALLGLLVGFTDVFVAGRESRVRHRPRRGRADRPRRPAGDPAKAVAPAVKRFWTDVALHETAGGWSIALDQRLLKTPARETLVVGSRTLGEAIADEWRACGEEIDPRAMPLTGLANAAIDHVAPAPARFAADLAQYAEGDLLCYRAEHPPKLVAAQAAAWDPLLDWARQRFDVEFVVTAGIVHVPQPQDTIARLADALPAGSPVRAGGPVPDRHHRRIARHCAGAVSNAPSIVDAAWAAVSLDDRWQIEQWGADDEAVASLANRQADFAAAARFLELLG